MSRVGKLPVVIPSGVKINYNNHNIAVEGKLGKLSYQIPEDINYEFEDDKIKLTPANDSNYTKAMWGLSRNLINNLVKGVSEGFELRLEINGVGYRSSVEGTLLTLILGFAHEIKYEIPEGIAIKCEKPTLIVISGADKQKVGQVAATIRKLRPPEPYKGKGIKFENEKIRRKVGKKK